MWTITNLLYDRSIIIASDKIALLTTLTPTCASSRILQENILYSPWQSFDRQITFIILRGSYCTSRMSLSTFIAGVYAASTDGGCSSFCLYHSHWFFLSQELYDPSVTSHCILHIHYSFYNAHWNLKSFSNCTLNIKVGSSTSLPGLASPSQLWQTRRVSCYRKSFELMNEIRTPMSNLIHGFIG